MKTSDNHVDNGDDDVSANPPPSLHPLAADFWLKTYSNFNQIIRIIVSLFSDKIYIGLNFNSLSGLPRFIMVGLWCTCCINLFVFLFFDGMTIIYSFITCESINLFFLAWLKPITLLC